MSMMQFPGDTTQPMRSLLADGAKLSWLSYSAPSDVDAQWAKAQKGDKAFEVLKRVLQCPQYVSCEPCDAQCYIASYAPPAVERLPDRPVMAICARGTTSLMDWCCDAQVEQVPLKDCNQHIVGKVHAGFYRQFVGLFGKFDRQVKAHLENGGHLLCVGHSLGSAISAIAALNYASGFPGKVWYIGYGTPRVFDKTAGHLFDRLVQVKLRVKNASDPVVAIVPPIGYVHVGTELHLGLPDKHPDVPLLLDVADHNIATYTAGLAPQAPT